MSKQREEFEDSVMDIQKERGMFEAYLLSQGVDLKYMPCIYFNGESYDQDDGDEDYQEALGEINLGWNAWQQAKKVAVPDGFVVVPREPTEKMLDTGKRQLIQPNYGRTNVLGIYKAMIEAGEKK